MVRRESGNRFGGVIWPRLAGRSPVEEPFLKVELDRDKRLRAGKNLSVARHDFKMLSSVFTVVCV